VLVRFHLEDLALGQAGGIALSRFPVRDRIRVTMLRGNARDAEFAR
jgi:hypothetical protein